MTSTTSRAVLALALAAASLGACDSEGTFDISPAPSTGRAGRCATCHMAEFRSAGGHVGKRPTTCSVCHSDAAWQPPRKDHTWALTGAHDEIRCFDCHRGQPTVFRGTSTTCIGCHRDAYNDAPRHRTRHYATTCDDCHSTHNWRHARLPTPTPTATAPVPTTPPTATAPLPTTPPTVEPPPVPTHTPPPDVTSHASGHR